MNKIIHHQAEQDILSSLGLSALISDEQLYQEVDALHNITSVCNGMASQHAAKIYSLTHGQDIDIRDLLSERGNNQFVIVDELTNKRIGITVNNIAEIPQLVNVTDLSKTEENGAKGLVEMVDNEIALAPLVAIDGSNGLFNSILRTEWELNRERDLLGESNISSMIRVSEDEFNKHVGQILTEQDQHLFMWYQEYARILPQEGTEQLQDASHFLNVHADVYSSLKMEQWYQCLGSDSDQGMHTLLSNFANYRLEETVTHFAENQTEGHNSAVALLTLSALNNEGYSLNLSIEHEEEIRHFADSFTSTVINDPLCQDSCRLSFSYC